MLKKIIAGGFASLFAIAVFAQNKTEQLFQKTPVYSLDYIGTVEVKDALPDYGAVMKNTVKEIHAPLSEDEQALKDAKAQANQEKAAWRLAYESSPKAMRTTANTSAPTVVNTFSANLQNGVPNDNTMAVSNGGWVVSATNSHVYFYDPSSIFQGSIFLASLFSSSQTKYDPKVAYDPEADRFVLVFLNGSTDASSRVVICFSTSNDPTQGWNVYSVNGNPSGLPSPGWTDFPQLGLNKHEVFITGNVFSNGGSFISSYIWQINKAAGYAGAATVPVQGWLGSTGTDMFAVSPCQGGSGLYGPEMYMVSTRGTSSFPQKTVWLHTINDTIGAAGLALSSSQLTANISYSLAPDADQKGTTEKLDPRDTRVRGAYYENNTIVFGCNSNVAGQNGLYIGKITGVNTPAFAAATAEYLKIDSFDIAYPGLAWGGYTDVNGEPTTLVFFDFTSPNHYPGTACVFYDSAGFSDPVVCLEGSTYINSNGGSPERWGDYAYAQSRYSIPGEVWAAGYKGYGSTSHRHGTQISQIHTPYYTVVAAEEEPVSVKGELSAYPVPANEFIYFEFDTPETGIYQAEIYDMQGKRVDLLLKDGLSKGKGIISFFTDHMESGTYFVRISYEGEEVYNKKFVVAH